MASCPMCNLPLVFIPELNRRVCQNPACPLSRKGKDHKRDHAVQGYEQAITALRAAVRKGAGE